VNSAPAPDHYSYRHYADPSTARTFDDLRFGGPIGALIAESQARVLMDFLRPLFANATSRQRGSTHPSILDVGTGTGRAALLLARSGARVTGIDASEAMLTVARQRAALDRVDAVFQLGDAHALAFPDRSFDGLVCLRVLMHTPQWRQCVTELCRVADRLVVADFPSARSVALAESTARRLTHTLGARTEPYRVFLPGTIAAAFAHHGFRVRSTHRQFVLPIALHKAVGSARFTSGVEAALAQVGLLRLFGSPVTIVAERCGSS
jgi:2-polyprenyl-3-methyl-5-hydroxy-6-metoxy-1,4-benzoquinol methylase